MIQRELQVVRLQYDFPGEWTFEGVQEIIYNKGEYGATKLQSYRSSVYHPHKRRTWKKRALCQSGWYRGSWKIRPGQNLSVRDFLF